MKFLAAPFPGNQRVKICKSFRQNFAAFFARVSETFRLNFALGSFLHNIGHTPSTACTFRKKFLKNSGKTPETLSERFLEFPSRVRLGSPQPCDQRHLRSPEHFQNSLPPRTAGNSSFFRSGSGEGLSEPVMEFPAVLGVFLTTTASQSAAICARFGVCIFRGFAKGWFPKGWFRRMFPRNENRNEGTFAKTTLLRNRPFISQ